MFISGNLFGTLIAGLLERPHKTFEKKAVLEYRVFDKLETEMLIYLPKSWLKHYRHGHTITAEGMLALTKFFENQFEEDLYKFCEMARAYKVQTKKAIEDFCWRHHISIEEDITYETLVKKEQRMRKLQQDLRNKNPQELSCHFYNAKKIF
ncbi:MAG: hypothetical protein BWY84_01248 [Candidatus Aerophobetes bacterium ADurb.Bin490]|nr:MAG: hypothetical protein BWY84_01248 [Candidatus Aerophobetes bacterium ADurb.Bin490]